MLLEIVECDWAENESLLKGSVVSEILHSIS